MITKDLGAVSAYAYAVEQGYTGTEAEYAELMASYATVAEQASQSAQTASEKAQQASASATSASQSADTASASATSAQASATTATTKASEAQQSATTATTKAQEASQSASTASQSASTAVQAKQDAESAKTASETAQASAESARDDAETARDTAQQYAESIDPEKLIGAYPTDTATGAIASFSDGADNIPMKKVTVRIEPKQAGSGDPSPDNVRPISGWTGCEVQRTGKNLLNPDISSWRLRGIAYRYINNVVPKGKTARLTFTDKDTSVSVSGINFGFVYDDLSSSLPSTYVWVLNNGSITSNVSNVAISGNVRTKCQNVMIYPQSEEAFNAVFARYNVVVELGTTASDYEPYTRQTYPITFPTEAGTVYGGTLDVTTGELVVDRAMVDLGTLTGWVKSTLTKGSVFRTEISGKKSGVSPILCSQYAYQANGGFGGADMTVADSISVSYLQAIFITDTRYDDYTALQFATAISGVQLCYELATPITLTLSPTEIKSLLGDNNLWADTGDTTAIYRADTTLYINRKIAEAVSALS